MSMELSSYLKAFKQDKLKTPIYKLGKSLFFDNRLSGNNNISCSTCHSTALGTGDSLPLSQGQKNKILTRNSPSLFELGEGGFQMFFWDGRVSFSRTEPPLFKTPVKEISGYYPQASHITRALKNPLGAQVLFPMINPDEMLGYKGENPIANFEEPLIIWEKITEKILAIDFYQKQFEVLYPDEEINIGHLANAIAHYITETFRADKTPFDLDRLGIKKLDEKSQRGLNVFQQNCLSCHSLPTTTAHSFANIGIPSIETIDKGLPGGIPVDFQFKTPSLRNVALTAPYMHNGAFLTLEEVIEHYNDPVKSLKEYDISRLNKKYRSVYGRDLKWADTPETIAYKVSTFDARLTLIKMTEEEKADLLYFLKYALTDESYLDRL